MYGKNVFLTYLLLLRMSTKSHQNCYNIFILCRRLNDEANNNC